MSGESTVRGAFVGEIDCVCGFIFDQYDDGYALKYADPDTAIELAACPDCGRDPRLLQHAEVADGS